MLSEGLDSGHRRPGPRPVVTRHIPVIQLPYWPPPPGTTRRNTMHTAPCVGDLRGALNIFNWIEGLLRVRRHEEGTRQ